MIHVFKNGERREVQDYEIRGIRVSPSECFIFVIKKINNIPTSFIFPPHSGMTQPKKEMCCKTKPFKLRAETIEKGRQLFILRNNSICIPLLFSSRVQSPQDPILSTFCYCLLRSNLLTILPKHQYSPYFASFLIQERIQVTCFGMWIKNAKHCTQNTFVNKLLPTANSKILIHPFHPSFC